MSGGAACKKRCSRGKRVDGKCKRKPGPKKGSCPSKKRRKRRCPSKCPKPKCGNTSPCGTY